ncbi:MAG TPA: DNA repair exonuclease [Allosphingosinicella sp.]
MSIRILHTADWQLGKPFARFPAEVRSALSEARLDVIDRIGAVAQEHSARHVLVAGDVFDNVDPGDRILVQALSRMTRAPATWWLMPGNHDHARADGLWSRVRAKAPDNVRVVDDQAEAIELEDQAWLLPAPLEHRRTRDDPTTAFAQMATPAGAVRIGLAHGSITEFGGSSQATNLIPPDRAQTAGLDYLALGDWHGHLQINERTAYSGTPEVDGFGKDEPGSVIVAEIAPGAAPCLQRVETGRFRWLSRQWDLLGREDFTHSLRSLRESGHLDRLLLDLTLRGSASLADRVAILNALDELAHELRWLGVSHDQLMARPTQDDLAQIDVQGTLAAAAATLQAQVDAGGPGAALASAALERLYIEAMRVQNEAVT